MADDNLNQIVDLIVELRKTFVSMGQAVVQSVDSSNQATIRIGAGSTDVPAKFINTPSSPGETVMIITEDEDNLILGRLGGGGIPPGAIMMYWAQTAPNGWLACNGQSTSGYTALANIVGANVPDLRNRFIVAAGSTWNTGNTGGANNVTLGISNMPAHFHYTPEHNHRADGPSSFVSDGSGTTANLTTGGGSNTLRSSTFPSDGGGTSSTTGSGSAFSILPSFVAILYIIKT